MLVMTPPGKATHHLDGECDLINPPTLDRHLYGEELLGRGAAHPWILPSIGLVAARDRRLIKVRPYTAMAGTAQWFIVPAGGASASRTGSLQRLSGPNEASSQPSESVIRLHPATERSGRTGDRRRRLVAPDGRSCACAGPPGDGPRLPHPWGSPSPHEACGGIAWRGPATVITEREPDGHLSILEPLDHYGLSHF
jgi:hypothetical protein